MTDPRLSPRGPRASCSAPAASWRILRRPSDPAGARLGSPAHCHKHRHGKIHQRDHDDLYANLSLHVRRSGSHHLAAPRRRCDTLLPDMVTFTPSSRSSLRRSRSCLRSPGPRTGCIISRTSKLFTRQIRQTAGTVPGTDLQGPQSAELRLIVVRHGVHVGVEASVGGT